MWPLFLLWIATSAATFVGNAPRPEGSMVEYPDAALSSADGRQVRLSSFRGKPMVLFYEDRSSIGLNQRLKEELYRRGRERNLLHAAHVVAVANLQGFNFFPARFFAVSKVEDIQRKAGVPVLIDWNGTLSAKPFNFPPHSSTVMVLDATGSVLFTHSGALTEEQVRSLLAELEGLVNTQRG